MFKLNYVFGSLILTQGFMWILFQRSWNNCWILWHALSKYATFDTMWTNYHLVIQSHDNKYPCQNEQMTFHQSLGGACPGKRIFSIFNGRTKMDIDHETRTWRWVWPSIWSVLRARPKCRWKMVTFWLSGILEPPRSTPPVSNRPKWNWNMIYNSTQFTDLIILGMPPPKVSIQTPLCEITPTESTSLKKKRGPPMLKPCLGRLPCPRGHF